ncbi:MAG: phage portal protein [Pseudomonadota bacterium]
MTARESYLSGSRGIAELTATVQGCVSLWEGGLSLADVTGTTILTPSILAMFARGAALRGEALFLIGDGLIPCIDWEVRTRNSRPNAYRVTIPEIGGGSTQTVLAEEVLHLRLAADPVAPWAGQAPLRRSHLTAGLLDTLERALLDIYDTAPLGSQIVPFPETPENDMETIGRGFRGQRGRVLLRESVSTTAAGGPVPTADWRPSDVTPDISKAMTAESMAAARDTVANAFGVLPALLNSATTGPMVREAQRHLAQWQLQPMAALLAEEATNKLGVQVQIDTMRPLQAYDAGGRARAVTAVVQAMAQAKEAGIDASQAMQLVDWEA